MRSLPNSEDPEKKPHNQAFHQGLHCLFMKKRSSGKEIHFIVKALPVTPRYIKWNIPSVLYETKRKNPI